MNSLRPTGGAFLWLLLVSYFIFLTANAQDCSSLNPCGTGCCNKNGYCGVGDDYCGADCIANCDYEPECSVSKPCAKGCCNEYGYCGLGPDFCGDKVCVGNCDRKSECDPDNYGDFAESSKCPLNVCCSKFGFCGTTKEFCGKKTVKRPSCSKNGSLNRVVGYYEGWSPERPCHAFYPEQIPLDLKRIDPDLKVFIAVGGWAFNDPGTTQTLFSDLAASESNQKKFFASLQSFMSTYDFDGIDLDWEYPVADDRGGRKKDFDNFPKFLANLKKSLKLTGGRDGLSITLPASYWYLQHFDISNLQKHVDFFNIMTYDIHGKWDLGNEWLDPVLDSHTNLTEITNALDLLWRNDIDSDKVVLGLAFYGRVFAAADTSCMEPGCLFASGGNPGKCSHEVGILLNSEIMDIMDEQNLKSEFDKEAAVKILKFDDTQWLTYDNGDTFKLKADFARSECLGGVMVWAVSHDLPHGNFSRTLGDAVDRQVKSLDNSGQAESMQIKKNHSQCKWTNCGIDCPAGWSRVRRSDDGARTDEHMWDLSSCSVGQHTFCCPPDADLPKCGWYTHNNGKCNSKCPSGTVEVGSDNRHCSNNNDDYQAACCTTDTPSMKIYSKCDWEGKARKCNGKCPSGKTEVALSTSGSGDVFCNPTAFHYTWNGQEADDWERRSYCCTEEDDLKWSECEWRDDIGFADVDDVVDGYCLPGCPDDYVRVAIDKHGGGCKGSGGRAKCCLPKYSTTTKRSYTSEEKDVEDLVKSFMKDPTCDLEYEFKRDLDGLNFLPLWNTSMIKYSGSLARRSPSKELETMESVLYSLVISYAAHAVYTEIWNKYVVSVYSNLAAHTIRTYLNTNRDWVDRGSTVILDEIICDMALYNSRIGGLDYVSCECETDDCCDSDDSCPGPDDDTTNSKRSLEKRVASARDYDVDLQDGGRDVVVLSWTYMERQSIQANDPILRRGFEYDEPENCLNSQIGVVTIPITRITSYQIEHVVELNTPAFFLRDAARGIIPSGTTTMLGGGLSATFVRQALFRPILNNPPVMTGGDQSLVPIERVMQALGSGNSSFTDCLFDLIMILTDFTLQFWRAETLFADTKMKKLLDATDPKNFLKNLRAPLTVITYLNHFTIQDHMVETLNTVRVEFGRAETWWVNAGNAPVQIERRWDQWIRDSLDYDVQRVRTFIKKWGNEILKYWAVRTGPQALQVNEIVRSLMSQAQTAAINLNGLA
ncbi:CAZyme family GH18 [Penicillium solitum]|uniref:CAZyme family GH18 n=1 Tax=Penicillium solitum TaxID=60172 RepID=UPI0032C437E0|nr:CAZyme family GH18 [Penicillium solitum]